MIDSISEAIGQTFMVILAAAYMVGGLIGAIYWAINDDLLFVVLSIFIPYFGAVSVIVDLIR